jgi:type IV pilus assembly protein PilV
MVEVLVAVLVLGVGLLGLAGLQLAGIRANESTRVRTEATIAAYDIADRLRANTEAFFPEGQGSKGIISIAHDACDGSYPTGALGRWEEDFCGLDLPQPDSGNFASVDCQDGNACGSGNCAISIRWDDQHASRRGATTAAADVKEFRFCTRLPTAI